MSSAGDVGESADRDVNCHSPVDKQANDMCQNPKIFLIFDPAVHSRHSPKNKSTPFG